MLCDARELYLFYRHLHSYNNGISRIQQYIKEDITQTIGMEFLCDQQTKVLRTIKNDINLGMNC